MTLYWRLSEELRKLSADLSKVLVSSIVPTDDEVNEAELIPIKEPFKVETSSDNQITEKTKHVPTILDILSPPQISQQNENSKKLEVDEWSDEEEPPVTSTPTKRTKSEKPIKHLQTYRSSSHPLDGNKKKSIPGNALNLLAQELEESNLLTSNGNESINASWKLVSTVRYVKLQVIYYTKTLFWYFI